jgi:hypothetical protein
LEEVGEDERVAEVGDNGEGMALEEEGGVHTVLSIFTENIDPSRES